MNKIIEQLENKNIAILGFGKEGYSTYKYIRKSLKEQRITIVDKMTDLKEKYEDLNNDNNINYVLGDNYLNSLDDYDIIIKTPGISFKNVNIDNIKDKITSQLELVLNYTDSFVIGITGTKGKSTTSSLLYKVLKDQKIDTYLVGNIGNPILDYIDLVNKDSILVTELSAHQLEYVTKSPNISIVLNLYEEHLDHYRSLEDYYLAKLNIFKYQNKNDYALYYDDNETLKNYIKNNNYECNLISVGSSKENTLYFDKQYIYLNNNKIYDLNNKRNILGSHNNINIMFVLGVVNILKLDFIKASESINNFIPLHHRLENIGKYEGIIFYDDTIATIPEATINAIKTLKNVDTLIIGGLDRGINYEKLINFLPNSNVTNFICMPETGTKIGKIIENRINESKKIFYVDSLEEAVGIAFKDTKKDMICLLSPAAPSYNKFKNFEEKGDYYKKLVEKHFN